ncbi:hypothetical protein BDV96DRAFT_486002 [Lophiotrema nucula]|uniref:Uncharacterized protein n=1 Tax=Lophiotrema nucula TaxID=690887 RepID=A0A6A5ZM32_9PLEO|nr:hypothetical protein BDV96DRAFT_486002 [Lophiotrema nucula]
MENNDRRQRQTNPSGYAAQQGTLLQSESQYPVVSASDRFRQAPLTAGQPPTSAPASRSRASAQSYGYAYGEGSQFVGSSIQPSGVAYGAQDYAAEQPRASQQYGHYNQNVMYNVPGPQASAAPPAQYEPVQPYGQQRDSSAIEVLTTGFGVAQPQQYYVGEGGPTSAPAISAAPPNVPSQYQTLGYTAQQGPSGRDTIPSGYSTAAMSDPQAPAPGYNPTTAYGDQSGSEYDDFYNNYQNELKKTFEHTRDGRLSEAAANLFRLSDWLLHWAETLGKPASLGSTGDEQLRLTIGLVRDDENHYPQRLKLWEEFNNCWLTTLQRQTTMLNDLIRTGQRPQPPQTLIEPDFLEKMGTQLVKNCDNIEKHGLVDYQMGVWEEEIIAMLSRCLDQWEKAGVASSSSQRVVPSASSSRRR